MKTSIMTLLILVIVSALPVWAVEAHHPESSGQPAMKVTQDKIDSCIVMMEESRLKMADASSPKEQKAFMHEHMQQMQEGMKMMDMMSGKDMMKAQDNPHVKMMEDKMQMMMEMMRGMMSQQEIMMKN
jgi:hypothetical protein